MTDESPPPPMCEPDTLRGEILDRLAALTDATLDGSMYSYQVLSNVLQQWAPGLIPAIDSRYQRARDRRGRSR